MSGEPRIYTLEQIRAAFDPSLLIDSQEQGFAAFSEGRLVVPPAGHLSFDEPPGDCHIKFGHIDTDDSQITIADLTGVAVQDIQIAKMVLASLGESLEPKGAAKIRSSLAFKVFAV